MMNPAIATAWIKRPLSSCLLCFENMVAQPFLYLALDTLRYVSERESYH